MLTPAVAAQLRENHKISQIIKEINAQDAINERDRENGPAVALFLICASLLTVTAAVLYFLS